MCLCHMCVHMYHLYACKSQHTTPMMTTMQLFCPRKQRYVCHVRLYIYTYIHILTLIYVVYASITYVHMYTYIHTYIYIYICIYDHICICIYIYIYIRIYIYICEYIHIYVYDAKVVPFQPPSRRPTRPLLTVPGSGAQCCRDIAKA